MNALLDTCTFLWLIVSPDMLSTRARDLIANLENKLFLSVASSWEIAVKSARGRLPLPEDAARLVPRMREKYGIDSLGLVEDAALQVTKLSLQHRDPFDRMLISQALHHGLTIISPDTILSKYPVKVFW